MYQHILLATDGSDVADRAAQQGLNLAKALGARVTAVTVIQPLHVVAPAEIMIAFPADEYDKHAQENADNILSQSKNAASAAGVRCNTRSVMHNDPWQAITDTANEEECDLIVMGSHGRSGLSKLVLGSETQKLLTRTTIPVLVVR